MEQLAMDMQQVFGSFSLSAFIEQYLHRLPLAFPTTLQDVRSLASWDTAGRIASTSCADVLLVREEVDRPMPPDASLMDLQQLCRDGWTIRVRHAERHDEPIQALAMALEQAFRGPVDAHIYITPPGCRGLSWHYDAEDVFILQTAGQKEYLLRKNTVHPWPLAEAMADDLHYERELMPLASVVLAPGDLLYIPCGYWHRTEAPAASPEESISLAMGVMSRSAIDLLPLLRRKLIESLVWRQRLPIGTEGDVEQQMRCLLSQLASDAAQALNSSEFLNEALIHLRK